MHEPQKKICMICMVLSPNCCAVAIFEYSTTEVTLPSSLSVPSTNTRAKRLRMRKVSIFKIAFANSNFTTSTPFFELKSNFISIQNFKAGNVKPLGMHWCKDF